MKTCVVGFASALFAAFLLAAAALSLPNATSHTSPTIPAVSVSNHHLDSPDFLTSPAFEETPMADVSKLGALLQLLAIHKTPLRLLPSSLVATHHDQHPSGTPPDLVVIFCRFVI